MGMVSVLKRSTMTAEGRGVISERTERMAGLASRMTTQRRVTTASFWATKAVMSGEGISMRWQRDGVRTESRICVSAREVWEVTAITVTLKL